MFAVESAQRDAWLGQIELLKPALEGLPGAIFFEFIVPRIGSRIDVVLIIGAIIFVVEFKVGEKDINREDVNQVWDYALDLKNFHQASHEAPIVPILVATRSSHSDVLLGLAHTDKVFPPAKCNSKGLRTLIDVAIQQLSGENVNAKAWGRSPYQPTPTIIEAAQALFAQHSVEAISRHDAGQRNLRVTSRCVEDLVESRRPPGFE